ncbi:glutathione S-transferase [Thalassotalea profundi]|uniref:Glutathione S-transferase n=1 Tax=Thalassotalea profundi TaxID=2036687 RepID=A0ABQ3IEC5_9GAMM|nr:glutathione S-transferase [Thalassotalea profundi]GHE81351.1 glutathione S-transferase [Thalassotalea profundi]
MTLPILYSLRNCPYAMRARLAIYKSTIAIELRDVVLTDKPTAMLAASPKGTVPIVVLPSGQVIDESLDVMLWALSEKDPNNLLLSTTENLDEMLVLINQFDQEFKQALEQYKCAKRYHESNLVQYRQACETYIQQLEKRLTTYKYFFGDQESLADIALLPFIRQFARVERQWYLQSPYPKLKQWLNRYLQSPMFTKIMTKYPLWTEQSDQIIFTEKK